MLKMILKIYYLIFGIFLLACSITWNHKNANQERWIEHQEIYPDAGFVIEFKYPKEITIARRIDNCICIGTNTEYYNENQASENDNTRQWCICVLDTSDYSIEYLISSWKSLYNGKVTEQRDSITIDNFKAIRVIFKSDIPETSYRQLIYLKKHSTLFEIMNVNEITKKDFETFCKSLSIKEYIKTKKE